MSKLLTLLIFALVGCSTFTSRYHVVRRGDTMSKIADRYGVQLSDILRENRSRMRRVIYPGDKVYIPFERSQASLAPRFKRKSKKWGGTKGNGLKALRGGKKGRRLASQRFRWPVSGRLTSRFGPRGGGKHEGIDIAAPQGTPVRAARAGVVTYSGNRLSGYGNLVIIKHSGQYTTVYAHLARVKVKKGQRVSMGRVLGTVGETGRASNPHLHFEVRHRHVPVNPLLYLRRQYAANILKR